MSTEISPYSPRPLTPSERRRGDLYLFSSPKCRRTVSVLSCMHVSWALHLEFDPQCVAYLERPRRLSWTDGHLELSFWARFANGIERMDVLVPNADTEPGTADRRQHRHERALLAAAHAASLPLHFFGEADVHARSHRIAIAFQLLPLVQAARRLPNRAALRRTVVEAIAPLGRATLPQLQKMAGHFRPAEVRIAVAEMIHTGAITLPDHASLTEGLVLTWNPHYEKR